MIRFIRIDYCGTTGDITVNRITEFVSEIQKMLKDIAAEINEQQAVLIVKIYDGKRLTYSFDNISQETLAKVNRLSRPFPSNS
jgi:hypothetical protein